MASIDVEFSVGDLVIHFTGIPGMITAIYHRAGKNSYEMSYLQDDKPLCVNVDVCELHISSENGMGFKKKVE